MVRAHTDPAIFQLWVGPDARRTTIDQWDARTGGSYRYIDTTDENEIVFRGCFHEIGDDRIVQTFACEQMPDALALEIMRFEDRGGGITRMHSRSLLESFEARDAMLASGMEVGVDEGYRKLDRLFADQAVPETDEADSTAGSRAS